jgi:hypothetical protein
VPQPPVDFALEVSSQGAPVSLLEELAGQVLRRVGCTTVPGAELTSALERATAGGTFGGPRRCDIQFRAHDHTLDILVSTGGGRLWQTSCTIP